MARFSKQVCVVTGGASGIGEALVRGLAGQGAVVVIADINETAAASLAQELTAKGATVWSRGLDVRSSAAIDALLDEVIARHGRLDVMINNAGIAVVCELEDTLDEDWDRLLDINVKGVAFGTRAALRRMKAQGHGKILNTASAAGLAPTPLFGAYSASKHAVVGLSMTARIEAAAAGISVCVLCPGVVETPIIKNHVSHGLDRDRIEQGTPGMLSPEACARVALAGLARNRAIITTGLDGAMIRFGWRYLPGAYSAMLEKSLGIMRRRLKAG